MYRPTEGEQETVAKIRKEIWTFLLYAVHCLTYQELLWTKSQ